MRSLIIILTIVLAMLMAFMGFQKFTGPNPVFSYIAEQSGIALFEPVVRMLTGLAEFAAAALLIGGFFVPRARLLGPLLSVAVIGGAIVFHLSPWLGINAPVSFDEAGEYVKSPMLFVIAVVFFAISALLVVLQRGQSD